MKQHMRVLAALRVPFAGQWTARLAMAILGLFVFSLVAFASQPTSGSISATSTSTVKWAGTATGTGAAQGEGTCVEGVNCDSFTLTVNGSPSDWANAVLNVKIAWTVPSNDYDLYVHKGDLSGPVVASSTGGAPETAEGCQVDPLSMGTGVYTVHAVYWVTSPGVDQYQGSAWVSARPHNQRTAVYYWIKSHFTPNTPVGAPATTADGEPSSRCDKYGNYYVAGIRGVPAGVDLWYFDLNPNSPTYDPWMRNPQYRGQPDSFSPQQAYQVGADGGGDVDIAVSADNTGPNNVPTIAFSSLVVANVSTAISTDLGNSWTKNPVGNVTGGAAVDDRQWLAYYGNNTVYLYYRTFQPAVSQIQQSTDGGLTYGPAITAGTLGQAGSIDVDQHDGTVYASGSNGQVAIGHPDPVLGYPTSYTVVQAANDPNGVANLFFIVKVANDGTVFGAYSNGTHVYLIHSLDHGLHWSSPVQVDYGPNTQTSIFPALAPGYFKGSAFVGWYGTPNPGNDDNADWHVYMAYSFNATSARPIFVEQEASDHVIHASNISLGGTLGTANRNLLDYFQICFDPLGAPVVGYTDDHIDYTGNTYVTREYVGITAYGNYLHYNGEGTELPARQPYSNDGSQVVDPPYDVTNALLAVVPTADPLDILSIKYGSTKQNNGDTMITAKMRVSSLSSIPTGCEWRMNFAVNCPNSGLTKTKMFSTASADRGDGFYLAAISDPTTGKVSSVYGTTQRNSDGSITYTQVGNADYGQFDLTHQTITLGVLASKLNPLIKKGPPIGSGTVLAGLRGSAFGPESGLARADDTRGGLEYVIP